MLFQLKFVHFQLTFRWKIKTNRKFKSLIILTLWQRWNELFKNYFVKIFSFIPCNAYIIGLYLHACVAGLLPCIEGKKCVSIKKSPFPK